VHLSFPSRFNVAEHFILPRLEAGQGAQPYLLCGEDVLTVEALHRRANRAAHALRGLGLRPGQRVALLLRESLDWPACFWGAVRAGVIPVPLNPALTAADYRHYLGDSRARALIVDAALWPTVAPALAGLRDLHHVLLAGGGASAPVAIPAPGAAPLHLEALLGAAREDFPVRRTDPDAPAFWLYTSGSTGRPKAAVHRQRDMVYVAETYLRYVLRLEPGELGFSAPKLFFAYGLGNSLVFPLASGSAALIQPGPATAAGCFALLAQHRPAVFYAVPTLFAAMLRLHEAWSEGREPLPPALDAPPRLEYLRLAVSGGEPLPVPVLEGWRARFGVTPLDGIGSTEALHFYVTNRPDALRPGSTGRPVPGYDVRLCDPTGHDVPSGTVGELWLRGGSVTPRYWGRPARNRRVLRDGWLATGDRFRRDADGFYWYEGRVDDLLKVGGSWLNPLELEHVLLGHPAVAECAVVGRADAAGLTQAHALVVPRPGHTPDDALAAALRAHVAARLAAFKVPHAVTFRTTLPRTATGKLQRFRLGEGDPSPEPDAAGLASAGGVAKVESTADPGAATVKDATRRDAVPRP
jgi:benzoate-CoA ligase family protein